MKNPPSTPPTTSSTTPPPSSRSCSAAEEAERSDERSKLETIIGMRRERSLTARMYETGQRKMAAASISAAPRCSVAYPDHADYCINNESSSTASPHHRFMDSNRVCSGGKNKNCSSSSSKRRCLLPYVLLVLTLAVQCCSSQRIVYRRTPWIRSRTSVDIPTFRGAGEPSRKDNESFYFVNMKYLESWGGDRDILLVGARNRVYMLDTHPNTGSSTIQYKERMEFPALQARVNFCKKNNRGPVQNNKCANYVREMYLMEDERLRVCGTNANSALCRYYKRDEFNGNQGADVESETCKLISGCICGVGQKRSVSIRFKKNGTSRFFAAGYDDGYNYRDWTLASVDKLTNTLITTTKKQFQSPDYIKILEYGKKVFLFFLESVAGSEVDYSEDSKIRYGRVAQVCKDDRLNHIFSTFVKARLYCNVPQGGSRAIVYDELTAVSDVVQVVLEKGQPAVDVVFATFTSPKEWDIVKQTSAVCMYTMEQINTLFNEGDFLQEASSESGTMYSVPISQPGDDPRLSTCDFDPDKKMAPSTISWGADVFLMISPVKPKFGAAIFASEANVRINSIKVDTNAGFGANLMLYLGTEQGLILRVKPRFTERFPTAVFMEEMNFADFELGCKQDPSYCAVKAIALTPRNSTTEPSLVVAFADRIVFSNLATCSLHINRTICEADPECGYNSSDGHCIQRTPENREFLGTVRSIEGDVEVVNKTETPAGMISDILDNYEPELTINLDKTKAYTIDRKRGCLAEVKSALKDTFNTVIENHNNFCPIHYNYTKQLTHLTPLLLHHIKTWHKLLLNKMEFDGGEVKDYNCIAPAAANSDNNNNNRAKGKECVRKANFTTPMAPSLWVSMKELLKEEFNSGLSCGTMSGDRNSVESSDKCSIYQCSHPNADGSCRPVRCTYSTLIDIRAFFRLPFYDKECWKPFRKPIEVPKPNPNPAKTSVRMVRGNLDLKVSPRNNFRLMYDPTEEEVTISYYYKISSRVRHNRTDGMRVQDVLNTILDRVFNSMNSDNQCRRGKRRRSANRSSNTVNRSDRNGEYCTKWKKISGPLLWEDLITRAKERKAVSGQGDETTSPNTLTFVSASELKKFFKEECLPVNRGMDILLRRFGAEEKRIKVDSNNKFVIEKSASHSKKWRVKFYGTTKPHHSLEQQSNNLLA